MKFTQSYSFDEFEHGTSTVLFVLTDTYSEIYSESLGISTDVFQLSSVKKDLNLKDGSYALDQLEFRISHLSCVSEDDLKAMYFALDATKIETSRYCAVFFESVSLENMLFCGKLASKVSGSDKYWNNGELIEDYSPLREYKFTALSFDFSIVEKVNLLNKIELPDGTKIDSVYERFETENWDPIKAVTLPRLTIVTTDFTEPNKYFTHQINLYDTLTLFLDKTSEILSEYLGDTFSVSLVESEIGIEVSPTKYYLNPDENATLIEPNLETFLDRKIKLHIKNYDSDTESNIYFSRKMIDPTLGIPSATGTHITNMKNEASNQRSFSFKQFGNVGELLIEIARSFGLYVVFNYTTTNSLNVEFKSRAAIVESDYTYLLGVKDAGFDTSSILTETPQKYYGQANSYSTDGVDETGNIKKTTNIDPSNALLKVKEERKQILDRSGAKSAKTLFTTSQTISTLYDNSSSTTPYKKYPYNLQILLKSAIPWDLTTIQALGKGGDFGFAYYENLHTGIYVKTSGIEDEQITRLAGRKIYRPAGNVYANINGEDKHFFTLSDYVNEITSKELQWYETEYSVTVPFWNGFSKGDTYSWKNLKLGSKFKLGENVKRYSESTWNDLYAERDYVAVSIEFMFDKPETKIKFHNIEKFAFGYFEGTTSGLPPTPSISFGNYYLNEDSVTKNYEVADGDVLAGDVVMLSDDSKIIKATAQSINQGKIIGIALSDGTATDVIPIQITGRATSENYSFSNINSQVFCRTNSLGINVSETILDSKTLDEDMIILLGRSDSTNSFIINEKEFILE